jgi:hypothetical protein
MFRVGQKVICVDASGWIRGLRWIYPVQGEAYTVRNIEPNAHGKICIRLEEIINPVGMARDGSMFCEALFFASRFRPLVERKTDIGFAHEILRKVSKKAPALVHSSGVRK